MMMNPKDRSSPVVANDKEEDGRQATRSGEFLSTGSVFFDGSPRDRLRYDDEANGFDDTFSVRRSLTESVRLQKEASAAMRKCALKASKAAEAEALAIARARGLEERGSVLDALALTLDANAERLAREEMSALAAREDAETKRRELVEQARFIEDAKAEQQATSRWLRREATRCEAEELARTQRLEAAEAATRARAAQAAETEKTASGLRESAEVAASRAAEREDAVKKREAACEQMEKEMAVKIAEVEKMRTDAAAQVEAVSARIADVDARAHAVASADASSKERVRVLAEKAEALAAAREELQRLAADVDCRAQDADARYAKAMEAERLSSEAEKKAADAKLEAKKLQELAAQDLQRSKEAALKESERASAVALATSSDFDRRECEIAGEMKKLQERQAAVDELESKTMASLLEEKKAMEASMSDLESRKIALAEAERELERKRREIAEEAEVEVEKVELLAQLESLRSLRADEASKAELTRLELEKATSTLTELKAAECELRREIDMLRQRASQEETSSILTAQPWLKPVQLWNEWESIDSVLSIARGISKEQSRAHEAARVARKTVQKIGKTTSWELLPREVRAGLRAGVALGDKVREACADLHAALVRRFLRLSAFQKSIKDDQILKEILVALRGVASQDIVRRRSLVQAIFVSTYSGSEDDLNKISERPAPKYEDATDLFKLRHNHFDALKLRLPAAKARFAAAAARWATPQFRQYLFDKAAEFNNLSLSSTSSARLDLCSGSAVGAAKAGVFFEESRLVLRFEDHGDHGRYAPRAACVFDDAKSLVAFFGVIDRDKHTLGVANGFLQATKVEDDPSFPHEIAIALDFRNQGILCDLRLRLNALEHPQRHIDSLKFLAEADSHEQILLPVWKDIDHTRTWIEGISRRDAFLPPPAFNDEDEENTPMNKARSLPFRDDDARLSWPAPPNWTVKGNY